MTDDTLPKTLEVTPRTFHSGLENLKREVANARPQPDPKPTSLAPKDIRFATSVFQPRTFEGKTAESEAHVDALKDAIRNSPNNLLDPIEVWWSGQSWKVLDGHHRLIAYRRLATDRRKPLVVHSIPVVVFEGTLNQAIARAPS